MLVGTLQLQVYIPSSTSLKEKRQVIKSVIHRTQNRFNVSIVELHNADLWQRATIGVAMVGDNSDHIQRQLQLVLNYLDAEPRLEILQAEFDLL